VSDDPSRQFTLQTRIDSGSDDVSAWSLTSTAARDLIASAKQTRGVDLLASPVITTLSGRAARIDVGKLPNGAFEPGGKATDTKNGNAPDQGPVYSANATGYVINKEPASQSQPALIGQSLELLPELSRDRLIVAGSFLDRRGSGQNKNPVVETRYSAPIYVKVPKDGAFALGQRSKAKGAPGEKYLLLLIVPKTED